MLDELQGEQQNDGRYVDAAEVGQHGADGRSAGSVMVWRKFQMARAI